MMITYSATLLPLSELKTSINFQVALSESQASFKYTLLDHIPQSLLDCKNQPISFYRGNTDQFERKNHLWLKDCFEFFIKMGPSSYLEFNFSLDGKWNVFQFTGYRENKQNYSDLKLTSFQKQIDNSNLSFNYLMTGALESTNGPSHATAILFQEGTANYFNELGHVSPEPDFHLFKNNM